VKERDARTDGDHPLVVYVEREDGTYGPIQTGSMMVARHLDDYREKRKHLRRDALERLRRGEISPIGFYLELSNISAADLAMRVRLGARKVRKHLRSEAFGRIGLPVLRRYADVFGIEVADLFEIPDQEEAGEEVAREATCNPLVVIRAGRRDDGE